MYPLNNVALFGQGAELLVLGKQDLVALSKVVQDKGPYVDFIMDRARNATSSGKVGVGVSKREPFFGSLSVNNVKALILPQSSSLELHSSYAKVDLEEPLYDSLVRKVFALLNGDVKQMRHYVGKAWSGQKNAPEADIQRLLNTHLSREYGLNLTEMGNEVSVKGYDFKL